MAVRPMPSNLAAVRGLTVGHWTDLGTATGCTVVLAPEGGMRAARAVRGRATGTRELDAHAAFRGERSEEHTSELQSLTNLVCRLLLEKKKQKQTQQTTQSKKRYKR